MIGTFQRGATAMSCVHLRYSSVRRAFARCASALGLAALMALAAEPARAQYAYPAGYGGLGWAGWGASTPIGDMGRGMGYYAAGQGIYNQQTAAARSVNADTAMRMNE